MPFGFRQKSIPDRILWMGNADVDQGILTRFDRFSFELHVGLLRGATSFARITGDTRADHVIPLGFSSQRSGNDVIHAHLAHG